jgi:hypothetical protein
MTRYIMSRLVEYIHNRSVNAEFMPIFDPVSGRQVWYVV